MTVESDLPVFHSMFQVKTLVSEKFFTVECHFFNPGLLFKFSDGPALVRVNIYVRSVSRIDDVQMVGTLEES